MKNELSAKCNCKSSFIWGFALPASLIAVFVTTFLLMMSAKSGRPEFGSPVLILGILILPILLIVVFSLNIFGLYRITRSECPNKMRVLIPNSVLFLGLIGAVLYLLAVLSASKFFG
jgi:hypothetical protein